MLVDPVVQSESYRLGSLGCVKIDTSDCVFELQDQPSKSILEVHSLLLGEDSIVGRVEFETQQLIEEIKADTNYFVLESELRSITFRLGVKLISMNYDENHLNQASL